MPNDIIVLMKEKELSFEYILKSDNNWLLFKELHKDSLSHDTTHEVEKMLVCCSPACGFATYICPDCGKTRKVPFTCKSKLCSRCGKKHTDIWADNLSQEFLNSDHRHIVLTMPDKLWSFFINNPSLQKLLIKVSAKVIKKIFKNLTIGFVMVIHPFGDNLKSNFHVHAIVTAGGLEKGNERWVPVNYISYESMRKIWQYEILTALRKHMPGNSQLNQIIDWCFKNRTNGFVIFADSIIKNSKRYVIGYIARYSRHPAISKRRILSYDGTYVTFSYSAYGKEFIKKMPKFDFIKAVLLHVSSKHFKTVRRFGLYSRRAKDKIKIARRLLPQPSQKNIQRFSWRRNLTAFTNKDPLTCSECGNEMELYKITYPDTFGNLKTIVVLEWLRNAEKQIRSKIHLPSV